MPTPGDVLPDHRATGLRLRSATRADLPAMMHVRTSSAKHLEARHGVGPWGFTPSEPVLKQEMRDKTCYVVEAANHLVATFKLSGVAPRFFELSRFADASAPATYLTGMAVEPTWQRCGVGRWCMRQIEEIARLEGSRAVRLDAYNHRAGAGPFYVRCGYTCLGPLRFNAVELLLFEKILG